MDDWAQFIEPVAEALLGKPTSRSRRELRYGANGSFKVNLETGWWDDWSSGDSGKGRGGGVLALIKREKGLDGKEAIRWMREDLRLEIEDKPLNGGSPRAASGERPRSSASSRDERPEPPPSEPEQPAAPKVKPKLVETYDYRNQDGELLFQVCRMEPKSFRQRRPPRADDAPEDIRGGFVWKNDAEQVPYRLGDLVEAIADERAIFIAEGEKDVDSLWNLGIPATCNAGGAGKWPDELSRYLQGADIVILPDNDPQVVNKATGDLIFHPDGRPKLPGQDHAKLVASKLDGIANSVRIVELPDLPLKGDVSDWLAAGGTSGDLYKLVASAAISPQAYLRSLDDRWMKKPFVSKFGAVIWGDPRAVRPRYEYIIDDLIPRRETVLIYGHTQSGKSFVTHDMAMAVAIGDDYLGRKVRRGIVIYCAAEAGAGFAGNRFDGYAAGKNVPLDEYLPFACLTQRFDLFGGDQQTVDLIAEIKALVGIMQQKFPDLELEAVVIDTFNKTTPGMDEINGKEVSLVMSRLDRIREELRTGLWLVHHMNAGGTGPRGHTSLLAAFETAFQVGRYDHTEKDAPPRVRDADNKLRDRRFKKVTKQREGEDGQITDFYLRGVVAGYKDDGSPIPGAVVEWIDDGGKRAPKDRDTGIALTDQRANVYRALRRAIEDFGVPAPASLQLPKGIERVVTRREWVQSYRKYYAEDDSESAVQKALQRANDFLVRNNIIARSNPWVWITGTRIKGETRTNQPPEDEPDSEDIAGMLNGPPFESYPESPRDEFDGFVDDVASPAYAQDPPADAPSEREPEGQL